MNFIGPWLGLAFAVIGSMLILKDILVVVRYVIGWKVALSLWEKYSRKELRILWGFGYMLSLSPLVTGAFRC